MRRVPLRSWSSWGVGGTLLAADGFWDIGDGQSNAAFHALGRVCVLALLVFGGFWWMVARMEALSTGPASSRADTVRLDAASLNGSLYIARNCEVAKVAVPVDHYELPPLPNGVRIPQTGDDVIGRPGGSGDLSSLDVTEAIRTAYACGWVDHADGVTAKPPLRVVRAPEDLRP